MSETAIEKKTWGEREGVTLDLLRKFTKPGCSSHGEVKQLWSYRGDCSEAGDRRLRASMSEEAYEHHHWDAVACNGRLVVVVPRWKFGNERFGSLGLEASYWWAMTSIACDEQEEGAGIRVCKSKEIAAVDSASLALLKSLPGLEFMHISKVSFYCSSKPGRKQWRKAPVGVRYFRFAAGYGLVAIESETAGS